MHYIVFPLVSWLSVAGALSISFPPQGTPTAAFDSQMISWSRDKSDPPDQFVIQKIKLDDGDGPSPKSTPVPIMNSQGSNGTSPFFIDRAGLFQILAVDIQKEKTFFSTEVTVVANPTSSGGPSSTTTPLQSQSSPQGSNSTSSLQSTGHPNGPQTTMTPTLTDTTSSSPSNIHSTLSPALSQGPFPTGPSHIKAIIGGIVGGVAFLFIIGTILLCLRYRTRRNTSAFVRDKMLRLHDPDSLIRDQWNASPVLMKDLDYSSSIMKRSSLSPQDSASNIVYLPLDLSPLPPIPAARSGTSGDALSSVSTSSSVQRKRDRETPRLSITTTSTSTRTSGSFFPIPPLPPRTRTDRQMIIEEVIQQHQAKILFLQEDSGGVSLMSRLEREELMQTNARVEMLKKAHESDWALGLTDDIPEGLF